MEVFGEYNDDRYENKGNISYKKLYEDNLNLRCKEMILDNLNGTEEVSLYQREFLGIDKECDESHILTNDSFNKFQDYVEKEIYLIVWEGYLFFFFFGSFFIYIMVVICEKKEDMPGFICVCYCIYLALIISCLICHIVFLPRITKYDISGYDCSVQ